MEWISWVAAGLTLLANVVVIKIKHWISFVIWGIGNVLYMYHWFTKEEWATFALVSVFLVMDVWGVISWRKKNDPSLGGELSPSGDTVCSQDTK